MSADQPGEIRPPTPCGGCGHAQRNHVNNSGLCLVESCRLCLVYMIGAAAEANPLPGVLRNAMVKQVEDLSFRYGRTACRDANQVTDAIEELLTLHPGAESLRRLLGWWLRQFDEQTVERPSSLAGEGKTGASGAQSPPPSASDNSSSRTCRGYRQASHAPRSRTCSARSRTPPSTRPIPAVMSTPR